MQLKKFIRAFEFFYPTKYSENWDNVGLQVGDLNKEIKRIICAFEITDEVINEAIEQNIDLIISHHPLIFREIKTINYSDNQSKKIVKLIQNDIAVYSAHTNIDVYTNGMSDWLAQVMGIWQKGILKVTHEDFHKKVEIETNKKELYEILDVLEKIGVGQNKSVKQKVNITPFVEYKKMMNNKKDTKPKELLLSFYIDEEQIFYLKKELWELKTTKDIDTKIHMFTQESKKKVFGLGKYGTIKPQTLETFAEGIKEKFDLDHVKITGNRENIIKTVAVVGGSGSSLIDDAISKRVDLLVTGDIGFHDAQKALENNLNLIDAGHYIEIVFNDVMKDILNVMFDIDVIASEVDVNPFEVI